MPASEADIIWSPGVHWIWVFVVHTFFLDLLIRIYILYLFMPAKVFDTCDSRNHGRPKVPKHQDHEPFAGRESSKIQKHKRQHSKRNTLSDCSVFVLLGAPWLRAFFLGSCLPSLARWHHTQDLPGRRAKCGYHGYHGYHGCWRWLGWWWWEWGLYMHTYRYISICYTPTDAHRNFNISIDTSTYVTHIHLHINIQKLKC